MLEFCNAKLVQLMGRPSAELQGSSIFSVFASTYAALRTLHHTVLETGTEQRAPLQSCNSRFTATAVLRRVERHDGNRVVWSFLDARESDRGPQDALWGTQIGLWDWDVSSDRLTWINDWCEHSQITTFAGSGHEQLWSARIHPLDLPTYRTTLARHLEGKAPPYDVEYRLRDRHDNWVWIQERGRVIERDAAGHALRAVGLCLDVTERHIAAHALQRSEYRFAHAVWATSVGLWDLDVATDAVHWWNDWCEAMDLDPCEGVGHSMRWDVYVHADDLAGLNQNHHALVSGNSDNYEAEYRVRTRAGAWRWIMSRGRVTARDAGGRPVRIAGVTMDIDARRRAEQTLRTQAIILDTLREGVVLIDPAGRVEYANPAFDQMLDRRGSGVDAISELLRQHGENKGKRNIELRRRDGSQFTGEVLSEEIQLIGGSRILIVVQDVSERIRLESEIIDIANHERRRLGADLHDGLGQELTGLSLMVRSLESRMRDHAEVTPPLNEIIALVNHTIQSVRKLALGVSPVTLERGGLLAALETLTGWAQNSYSIAVKLQLVIRSPLDIDELKATHLHLIVQEAINNAVKHARPRSVIVTLRTNRSRVYLSVTDDGTGIEDHSSAAGGMGLKIMKYRAAMIGGILRVKRMRGAGTRIQCVCPHS
jgi:signal transduction histidine kinase